MVPVPTGMGIVFLVTTTSPGAGAAKASIYAGHGGGEGILRYMAIEIV